jgi:glycosyltransferase involved in cell wall biosynthesis
MADQGKRTVWIDPSKRAGRILDSLLEEAAEPSLATQTPETTVEEELNREPLVPMQSTRVQSRALFITQDITVFQKDSSAQLHFLNISNVFDEVHVLVLCGTLQVKKDAQRLSKNVWLYPVSSGHWWQQPFAALTVAEQQLRFGEGFRPDIIVALDPAESGLAGLWIAKRFQRLFQVHVREDFFDDEFTKKEKKNKRRVRIVTHVLKRIRSVRFESLTIKEHIEKRFPSIPDMGLLPRHYDIQSLLKLAQSEGEDAFPQFSFTILFAGKLDHESTLFRALDASRPVLSSKNIGMVVVGDGPSKKEFQKRAELLGIQEQVLFLPDDGRLPLYLRSADVLLCTDTTEASDELTIKAAAAGLPLIAAETPLRKDLFTDGESAFLCSKEETTQFTQKLTKFLNGNVLRVQFSTNARDIVKSRLHEDPEAYRLAYRDAIESLFTYTQ